MDESTEEPSRGSLKISDALNKTNEGKGKSIILEGLGKEEDGCLLSESNMLRLAEWNSVVPEQLDKCVHEMIIERCRAQPNAPAVCAWDGEFTYGELDVLSSALAAHLAERGVGPEVFVPLCFEKSGWTTVAMVGVMKAGGAFVLLDCKQPLPRLQELCASVKAALVLSSPGHESRSQGLADTVVVVGPATGWLSWCGRHNSRTAAFAQPNHAVYATFTSGSTGKPKAVVVEHSAYCSNAFAHSNELQLNKDSRILQLASYAFGASIVQMVTVLMVGGCICVPSDSQCRDNIAAAARKLGVNWALFTPSILRIVRHENMPNLKHVVLGGESPAQNDIIAWPDHVKVIAAYGSSETSVLCAVAQNMGPLSSPRLIGKMTGSVGWVVELDNHHKLVPLGAVGELLVEGPILARGYLNDTKRTSEAFIEAPSWFPKFCERHSKTSKRDGRMYKTGDLVQYNADGSLTFVGRKDTQVKIRGQRVELGEVEHHFRQIQTRETIPLAVAEVVTPRGSKHPMLVIYIAIGEAANGSTDEVRAALERWTKGAGNRLAARVPQYMVPSAYLAVDMIPMTATGKTDRRRLREMGGALTLDQLTELQSSRGTLRVPSTAIERQLHGLWASVLNLPLDRIGADDNFLRIGADSITAVELVAAAREEGLSLTVADVFNTPCLGQMARAVKAESYVEETILPFSLLQPGIDANVARALAAAQCGVDIDLVEDVFPCTPLQEGMLALTAKRPGDYISQTVFELRDGVEPKSLERAWKEVVAAVPILRTRVVNLVGQGLVQVVVTGQVSFTACQDLGAYLQEDKQEPMGLGVPLTRFAKIDSCSGQRAVLVWTVHHALFDGWSMPLVLKQVEHAYHGRSQDHLTPFQGFVKHILKSSDDTHKYWQSHLGESEAVPFPSLPSPGYQSQADDYLDHQISGIQWPQTGITASTMVRAAWAILQGQYTNSSDVIFGATVTGRQVAVPGVERMAGPTIATVPVRVRWNWETDIQDMLQEVQAQAISMTAYEQTGLQYIRQISLDTEMGCRFQTLMVVQPSPRESGERQTESDDLSIEVPTLVYKVDGDAAGLNLMNSYVIMLECHLRADGVKVRVGFDSHVVEKAQVQRMVWHLGHLLRELCAERSVPLAIRDVCGISHEDLRKLVEWNQTVPARVDRCVPELVEERCRAQPNAPAVCAWDGDLTYGELDVLSSALAAYLAERGVGPEVFVPLCFEKSRWTTVAMFGVMKAGGAFVLLDPSYPRARLEMICQAVSAPLVVSSAAKQALAARLAPTIVVVGGGETPWRSSTQGYRGSEMTPDNALYAVFTSGSTGIPKGVVISYGAFTTSAIAHSQHYLLTPQSRVFQFTSYAFDVSIIEILTTILVGGCVCVPSDTARNDIAAAANELQVSIAQLTPSTARLLLPGDIITLETLVLIGEPVTSSDIDQWGGVRLVNGYGPAECSAISSIHPKLVTACEAGNIGWATGCVCWVVDQADHKRLVPIGAVGELLIEGPIVGRGYLNDPERTAAAFIAPPAWLRQVRDGRSGGRLYKTGDLVQYAVDGSLQFKGRKDTQVKLRGQRIELGEVEHHTRRSFPGARDVVAEVVTPAEAGRAPILVAFVSVNTLDQEDRNGDDDNDNNGEHDILAAPTNGFRTAIPAAETALQDTIPAYMVPAVFLPLRGMPLSATGKTDRRRLRDRAAALSRAEIEAYYAPMDHGSAEAKRQPTTPAERTLQQLWAQVLNLPPAHIGADDSFFRLGGDSITAMQLSAYLRSTGLSLRVSDIFHAKTIAQLTPLLSNAASPLLDNDEREDVPFELSPIQQLFFDFMPSGANYFNQSFLLPIARRLTLDIVTQAVNMIVRHHTALRTRFRQADDGGWVQVITSLIDHSYRCQGTAVASLDKARDVMRASQHCLNFQDGPIFAVDLIDVGPKEQYLFLVAHHLVIDLVSWRVILGDLEELLQTGKSSGARSLPFQTWCRLQAEYSYENLIPAVALPSPNLPPPQGYWGSVGHQNTWSSTISSEFILGADLTATLFGAANDALQTQPVEIFQAALWHAFVRAFPDRPPPTIFNESHGREPWDPAIDLIRTVGWFTTIWPTYIAVDTSASIIDIVRHTKDARRRTPSNGWAYFASRFLNPVGRTALELHGPVEIAFNYQGLYQQFEQEGAILQPPIRLENHVPDMGDDVQRFALIDVSAAVEEGCLRFSFCYNRQMQHQDAIAQWITNCEQSLRHAARQLTSMDPTHTLCDFPLMALTYSSLDTLLNQTLPRNGVMPREVEDVYPCSPMQRGLLLSQAKDSRLYQTRFAWKVTPNTQVGSVDVDRFWRAWQQVVTRHAILRTIFVDSDCGADGFKQVVRRSCTANIKVIEAVESANHDPTVILQRYPRAANLIGQPAHRLLVCATPTGMCCALEINHALIDAHSTHILQRDLRLAYDGQLPAEPAPLYSDYIAYLGSFSETSAEIYWKSYMQGGQPCLLPTLATDDTPIQQKKELRSATITLGAGAHLHEFCQHHEVTLSNLFQVAWGLVLQIYTGSDAACFGYLNSGRDVPVPGVHATVGPFINMLVCRVETNARSSVLSMLQKNQVEYLQGLPHQHFSLAGILHQANAGGRPLFNTTISLQRPWGSGDGGEAESHHSITLQTTGGEDPTEYDAAVTIAIGEQDISISLGYWTTSLRDERASAIASTLRQIVQNIVDRPHSIVRDLNILSGEDQGQIYSWNGTVPARVDRCVHELIVERCSVQPDAPAVCAWDGDFTYGELDVLSSALAAYLAECGVGPEIFVPLCFEKSRWTTVAIVGVIKAGGAFVLLDPSHPRKRLETICQAVSAPLVVSSVTNLALAADLATAVVVVGDDETACSPQRAWRGSAVTPDNTITPDIALYAVFTSGSTGNPKGVIIPSTAFATSAVAHSQYYLLNPQSRVFQFSSYAFDASI